MLENNEGKNRVYYLECERIWVFLALMLVGGYYGGYTYSVRGGVFSNAQTANLLLLSMNLGMGRAVKAASYLIPFAAYLSGIVLSEVLAKEIKRFKVLRWDTVLVGFELISVILLGIMPGEWPDQICQVSLSFICAMQFNTFRQAEGVGMATTFCTNHLRQFGSFLVRYIRDRETESSRRLCMHGTMLLMFMLGVLLSTAAGEAFGYRSIWGAGIFLIPVLVRLVLADRTYERELLERVPRGH